MIVDSGKYYLYRHISLDNNQPFYIGIGTKLKNFSSYKTEYKRAFTDYKRNIYWKRIVHKYGYLVEILLESDNSNFIKEKEIEFIDLYKRSENGGLLSNMTLGGDGTHGLKKTEEEIKKLKIRSSGVRNLKSKKCYQYDIDCKFIAIYDSFNSAAVKNNFIKQNLLSSNKSNGTAFGYYWKDNLLTSKELKLLIDKKKEIANENRKGVKILMIDPISKTEVKQFNRIIDAKKHFNLTHKGISRCLQGRVKTSCGFEWKYANN